MHIAIDVRSLMGGRHSGVEEYTTQIIRAMSVVAPMHTYHLFYNNAKPVLLPKFRENIVLHPFRYPNKLLHASQLLLGVPKWDTMLSQHIDVVFVPNSHLVPLSRDIPLVSTAHDIAFERFPEFLTIKRRVKDSLMRPRDLFVRSQSIIAVSEHTKRDLIDIYSLHENSIAVIYPGVASQVGGIRPVDVQRVVKKYAIPAKFLLFVGTMEPRKNIGGIIAAFSAIANRVSQDLVIAGEQGWKMRQLMTQVARSPYADRIHVIGFVEEEDKQALYAAADLFVYPSFYEGFGFPPLEAMLAGTPAIASFNSSLPEVVGKWATLIDPYNTSQIAAVLEELLVTPQRVPISTQKEIQEKYSWERAAKETVKILESVV